MINDDRQVILSQYLNETLKENISYNSNIKDQDNSHSDMFTDTAMTEEPTAISDEEFQQLLVMDMVRNKFKITSNQQSHQSQSNKPIKQKTQQKPMQLTLWSYFNPSKVQNSQASQASASIQTASKQNSGKSQNQQEQHFTATPHREISEVSIDNSSVRIIMSTKLKNTQQYLLSQAQDPQTKKLMETEEGGPVQSWLIDTEIVEINKRLWQRKQKCKQLLKSVNI